MVQCIIYYLSAPSGKDYKDKLREISASGADAGKQVASFEIRTALPDYAETWRRPLGDDNLYIFCVEVPSGKFSDINQKHNANADIRSYPSLFLLSDEDYPRHSRTAGAGGIVLRASSMDSATLSQIINTVFQREYYQHALEETRNLMKIQAETLDYVFELSRRELFDAKETTSAFENLTSYEREMKKQESEIRRAYEKLLVYTETEVDFYRRQAEAEQSLLSFKDQELAASRELQKATEGVLEYSRQEQVDRQQILLAQEALREFTDTEHRKILDENRILRERLGLPPSGKI